MRVLVCRSLQPSLDPAFRQECETHWDDDDDEKSWIVNANLFIEAQGQGLKYALCMMVGCDDCTQFSLV